MIVYRLPKSAAEYFYFSGGVKPFRKALQNSTALFERVSAEFEKQNGGGEARRTLVSSCTSLCYCYNLSAQQKLLKIFLLISNLT